VTELYYSTGLSELDEIMGGGVPGGSLVFLYGEEKSGKTSIALRICVSALERGENAVFIDCSSRLHPIRLTQVLNSYQVEPSLLSIAKLDNFLQQEETVIKLYDLSQKFGLIIFDDFTYQHRLRIEGNPRIDLPIYKRLAFQAAALKELASKSGCSVILVGQVHDMPETGEERAVAYRLLSYWADWVLRVKRPERGCREILVEKPIKSNPILFEVTESGISPCSKV